MSDRLSEKYRNITMKYSHDQGSTWTAITFSNVNYSYEDIQAIMKSNIESNEHDANAITLRLTPALFKVLEVATNLTFGMAISLRGYASTRGWLLRLLIVIRYQILLGVWTPY